MTFLCSGGYDDLPSRLGRRGDWEGRHLDYRDDWGPRGREDRRGDLRMGRRGEFLDIRDGHRFEDPAMFRRMDREEMLRLRLEGEYRDRREPSNPRESLYVDLRREDRGERRDDRLERGEEAFERSRRDDHMDERLLRRDEREGGRMERRDNLRYDTGVLGNRENVDMISFPIKELQNLSANMISWNFPAEKPVLETYIVW